MLLRRLSRMIGSPPPGFQSVQPFSMLFTKDSHNATHIELDKKMPQEQFEKCITEAVKKEIEEKNSKSIWVHLNRDNLGLVSHAMKHQFKIHHGIDDKIVMYRWISELTDLVPPFSRFYIACGAVVIKDGKLLMIQQKNGARKDDWGVPGGQTEMNEPLANAAQRELLEQTAMKAKYRYIIFFRELENTLFGGTDLYFGCVMDLPQEQLKNFKLCQRQLQTYKWVDLDNTQQFCKNHQVRGTQKHLLLYLGQLHQKKYKFNEEMPNTTHEHRSTIRGLDKYFKEHRFINI